MADLCRANNKIKGMEEEETRLCKCNAELEASCLSAEDESEREKALINRAEMIGKIRELEDDCVATLGSNEQMKIVNPEFEMITRGISTYYKVEASKIELNEGIEDWDTEEEKEEEE